MIIVACYPLLPSLIDRLQFFHHHLQSINHLQIMNHQWVNINHSRGKIATNNRESNNQWLMMTRGHHYMTRTTTYH